MATVNDATVIMKYSYLLTLTITVLWDLDMVWPSIRQFWFSVMQPFILFSTVAAPYYTPINMLKFHSLASSYYLLLFDNGHPNG